MPGHLTLLFHAHLPFVRHPEHEKFLEESWLYEAISETYIPFLQMIQAWREERLEARVTLTLSPTLCSILLDPLFGALRAPFAGLDRAGWQGDLSDPLPKKAGPGLNGGPSQAGGSGQAP